MTGIAARKQGMQGTNNKEDLTEFKLLILGFFLLSLRSKAIYLWNTQI